MFSNILFHCQVLLEFIVIESTISPEAFLHSDIKPEKLLSESTHRTLTEAVDDISLGNFQTKLKKVILNLKEAYDDLNPNVDKFDVASTIINGSLNDLKMLDKAIQEFNSEETM